MRKKIAHNMSFAIRTFMIMSAMVLPAILSQGAEAHMQSPASALNSTAIKSTFQRGVVYPRYVPYAYGKDDQVWQGSVPAIKTQTAAQWIEMPVLFEQATSAGTAVVS